MDRVSAILIFGIMSLVMISSYIVFDTWLQNPGYDEEILVFNDDTSVINNSTEDLWIRAKISEKKNSDNMAIRINENFWIDGKDGWHYYEKCLKNDQRTEPFARSSENSSSNAKAEDINSFSVKVEAVEQARLPRTPKDCQEAFILLKREKQEAEPILL